MLYFAIGVTIYLVLVSAWDLYQGRVPNFLTLPLMIALLGWRLIGLEIGFLFYWVGCYIFWSTGVIGGGDAKLLMILFGLFPQVSFFYTLIAIAGIMLVAVLLARYAKVKKTSLFFHRMSYRLSHLKLFPQKKELDIYGEPFTLFISFAGITYVWAFTGVL